MDKEKKQRLEETVASIRHEYGEDAVRPLRDSDARVAAPHLPTGFATLDQALGGGVPRGSLTEFHGIASSGLTTVTFRVLANAQAEGDTAAYIDLTSTFDGEHAVRCGVNVSTLFLVRPDSRRKGLSITHDLISLKAVGIIVLDFGVRSPVGQETAREIRAISSLLAHSDIALIVLHSFSAQVSAPLSQQASLRLQFELQDWLHRANDIRGWRSLVTIQKSRRGPPGRVVNILIKLHKDAP